MWLPGIKKPGPMSAKIKSTGKKLLKKMYEAMMDRAPNAIMKSLSSEPNFFKRKLCRRQSSNHAKNPPPPETWLLNSFTVMKGG